MEMDSITKFKIPPFKIPKYKELPLFGVAKVMENLIQQNFEMNIFKQFSTSLLTFVRKVAFWA